MANEKVQEKKYEKKPYVGAKVWFCRQAAQSTGPDQILIEHAIITGLASKASNFQFKDMAVNLRVLPDASGSGELQRSGIMHSPTKKPGHWTWNTDDEEYIRNVSKTNAP